MVTWTRLNITFYLHWLSCLFSKWFGLPVRPNQPTTHMVNGPLYPEKMWSACDGDHTHTDGALKLRTIWTLLLLLLQSALPPLWVLACSAIVEYSQQEGFLQSTVASGTSNPPTWSTSDLERSNSRHKESPASETTQANPSSGRWNYGREISENFAESGDFHVTFGFFYMQ